jgi:hypothetical protein
MSFATDITLADDTPANHVYSQISLESSKSIRNNAALSLGTPETMIISHTTSGKGMTATDRHLVRLNHVEEDTGSTEIATLTGSVYIVLEKPRRIITDVQMSHMVTQLINFLTAANLTKLLAGEP